MIYCTRYDHAQGEHCGCPAVWVFLAWGKTVLSRLPEARCAEHCGALQRAVVKRDPSRRGSAWGSCVYPEQIVEVLPGATEYRQNRAAIKWAAFTPSVWETWKKAIRVKQALTLPGALEGVL